jgi:acylphosphatase
MRAIRYIVAGRVQGVFYRAATADRAQQLGLHGSARNLADGRVEVIVAGGESAQSAFAAWLWQGPPAARVDAVQIEEWREPVAEGFAVTR